VQVDPATAVLIGPRFQLEALQAVTTEPVNVDGADGPVEAQAAVRSPNPLMRVVEPLTVRVVVEIAPARADTRGGRRR
jgi:hypothetical protein